MPDPNDNENHQENPNNTNNSSDTNNQNAGTVIDWNSAKQDHDDGFFKGSEDAWKKRK
jgi:hypothetical protein